MSEGVLSGEERPIMADSFISLAPTIVRDLHLTKNEASGVDAAMSWLHTHPSQVPGQTITESQLVTLYDWARNYVSDGWRGRDVLADIGITVIPDPEPTNAEKLEALLENGDINAQWGLRGGGVTFARELAHALDEAGVRAPGGDDD